MASAKERLDDKYLRLGRHSADQVDTRARLLLLCNAIKCVQPNLNPWLDQLHMCSTYFTG